MNKKSKEKVDWSDWRQREKPPKKNVTTLKKKSIKGCEWHIFSRSTQSTQEGYSFILILLMFISVFVFFLKQIVMLGFVDYMLIKLSSFHVIFMFYLLLLIYVVLHYIWNRKWQPISMWLVVYVLCFMIILCYVFFCFLCCLYLILFLAILVFMHAFIM